IYSGFYYAGLFAAFLTAFYTFRAFCLTFHGEERIPHEAGHHAHESPAVMTVPLVILAFCAVVAGIWAMGIDNFLKGDWGRIRLAEFLSNTPSLAAGGLAFTAGEHEFHMVVAGVSTLVAVAGIGLAMYLYLGDRSEIAFLQKFFDAEGVEKLADPQWVVQLERIGWIGAGTRGLRQAGLGFLVTLIGLVLGTLSLIVGLPLVVLRNLSPYKLSSGKFYFDEIYDALIVTPLLWLSHFCYWIDRKLVDGLVDLAGSLPPAVGSLMRGLQGGQVQFYAIAMVLGVLILIAARLLLAG
ncbi:MAG TPA: hypothetical protein VFB96_09410, partial [Pirellulaceae bacterium]|nr:hypothetical protein [Pirellulaceae bacterium]